VIFKLHELVDLDVILKAKSGDKASITEILYHFRNYIDYTCNKTLKNAGIDQVSNLNEDCRQHVFMQLIKAIEKFDPDYQK
jgi:hypothetical protein